MSKDTKNIIEELNKARKNKTPLKESRVEGDIVATFQVSKRNGSNKFSEMSLYEIEGDKFYLVLHENKEYPSPEEVKNNAYERGYKLSYRDFNVIVRGIINYREKRLQEFYVNTYSYIIGWCRAFDFDIQEML